MPKRSNEFKKQLPGLWSRESVICRLIAAWTFFAAFNMLRQGLFTDLSFAQDTSFVMLLLVMLLCFAAMSAVKYALHQYETDSWFLMLGAFACVSQWLARYSDPQNEFLFTLAVIGVFALFAVYFVQKNEDLWPKLEFGPKTLWAGAVVIGLICAGVIGVITCLRHMTFAAPNFDFGLFVNMFHNMKETGLPVTGAERDVLMSHFAVHLSPIYYLLLPFYAVFPSPLTLQIGQAVVLASGVIPVMLLCRHFKLSGRMSLLLTALYAFYPALSSGCFYDIHENCFLTPLLLWVFYFYERKKMPWMYLFAILVLLVKEDAAVYILLFAVYVIFGRKDYFHGGILACGALLYFGLALKILEEYSAYYKELYQNATPNPGIDGPMINRFNNLIFDAAEGLVGVVRTALFNPGYLLTQLFTTTDNGWGKVIYFAQMFLPLGLIPFFSKKPTRWLLIVPVLMNLLTRYKYQYDTGFQYHFGITAFLVYGTVMNLPELKRPLRRNLVTVAAVACCCFYMANILPTAGYYTQRWESGKEQYQQMEQILDTIPEDASVATSTFLLSHIADREEVYEIRYHYTKKGGQYVVDPDVDYIIFDGRYAIDQALLRAMQKAGYEITQQHDGLITILQKAE